MSKRSKIKLRTKKVKKCKDKATINFLLQHLKEDPIDFSKVSIPLIKRRFKSEKKYFEPFCREYSKDEASLQNQQNSIKLPIFGLSLLEICNDREEENTVSSFYN